MTVQIRSWARTFLVVALTGALGFSATLAQDASPEPWYPQPEPVTGALDDVGLHNQLIAHKQDLCQDLEVASSLILNTGALNGFRPLIQEVSGLNIGELEIELQTCTPSGIAFSMEHMTAAELVQDVRMVEWLLKIHLVSLDQATFDSPQAQALEAEGPMNDFLQVHSILIDEMRVRLAALTDDTATVEEGNALGDFWRNALIPHTEAENSVLFPMLRESGNSQMIQSANVIESEHAPIEVGVAEYMTALEAVNAGSAEADTLIPIARQLRGSVELHFGREEATLIQPLMEVMPADRFAPVVEAQDEAIGAWLRAHGWEPTSLN